LDTLTAEALKNNSEILAAQKKYEAAARRPVQAGSLPDPMLSLGYQSSGGPWPGAGLGTEPMANMGFMVSQEVPFPGKRKLRADVAGKEAEAEFEQYLAARLSVISRLKAAWHELRYIAAAEATVRRYQEILNNFLQVASSRYAVGRAAQQDIFKAQTQFAIFETQLERWRQERASKTAAINALLKRPQESAIAVPVEIAPAPFTATRDDLISYARTHAPMLERERKMIERAEISTNLARKERYPDYTFNGGYFNQGSMPPMFMFRVDLKLPVWGAKQRAMIDEQSFIASEARRNYESADVSLRAKVEEDYTMATTSRRLMDLYSKSVIPQARLTLESSTASYQTGSLDFLALFMNFQTVVEYELMYQEESMRYHVALARLEGMTGMELLR
jgi:outer membrane protein TolC